MRYVSWFIGLIAVIILSIFGVILIRNTLRGFNSTPANTTNVVRVADRNLSNTTLEYVVYGPIVADENFRSVQFRISEGVRTATTRKGYQDQTIAQQQLGNNSTSFSDFAQALDTVGFGRQIATAEERPIANRCPGGRLYTIRIIENGETKLDTWSDSCLGNRAGTFGGNRSSVDSLFRLQFPEYNSLIQNIGGRF